MLKPVRLELNNSGAWKLLGRFDAFQDDAANEIMDAADRLAKALNDPACGRRSVVSLRIITDENYPVALMRWLQDKDGNAGWRDAETGEAL
jgi:hypothetical protein